jgi:hypothetical protein
MERREIETLIYGNPEHQRRFTQDFPVLPDVWIAYAEKLQHPDGIKKHQHRIELLLTPHTRCDAATVARALKERLEQEQSWLKNYRKKHPPAAKDSAASLKILLNESVVFANFTFEELIRLAMPLTDWWKCNIADCIGDEKWTRKAIEEFVRIVAG